jgi:NAD(P)H-nitrite reductase large subunit
MIIGENTILGAIIMGDQSLSRPLKYLITDQIDISSIRESLITQKTSLPDLIMAYWNHILQEEKG